jgi:hypothetical protein
MDGMNEAIFRYSFALIMPLYLIHLKYVLPRLKQSLPGSQNNLSKKQTVDVVSGIIIEFNYFGLSLILICPFSGPRLHCETGQGIRFVLIINSIGEGSTTTKDQACILLYFEVFNWVGGNLLIYLVER